MSSCQCSENKTNEHDLTVTDRGAGICQEDGEFRTRLLNDPKAAVKDATGFSVPDDINIHVLGDNATDCHLVLASAGRNLSDGEISGVAGRIGVDGVRNATGTPTW